MDACEGGSIWDGDGGEESVGGQCGLDQSFLPVSSVAWIKSCCHNKQLDLLQLQASIMHS
jgi:hypothetical protein